MPFALLRLLRAHRAFCCVAQHYSTFQPALESMRLKYEQAMKDKMLMKLERDRVKTRVSANHLCQLPR